MVGISSSRRDLNEALCDSLSYDDVRRLVKDVAPRLFRELREQVSLAILVSDVTDLLARHAQFKARFFQAWAEMVPARSDQIAALASSYDENDEDPVRSERSSDSTSCRELVPQLGGVCCFLPVIYWTWRRRTPGAFLLAVGTFLLLLVLPSPLTKSAGGFLAALLCGAVLSIIGGGLEAELFKGPRAEPQPSPVPL